MSEMFFKITYGRKQGLPNYSSVTSECTIGGEFIVDAALSPEQNQTLFDALKLAAARACREHVEAEIAKDTPKPPQAAPEATGHAKDNGNGRNDKGVSKIDLDNARAFLCQEAAFGCKRYEAAWEGLTSQVRVAIGNERHELFREQAAANEPEIPMGQPQKTLAEGVGPMATKDGEHDQNGPTPGPVEMPYFGNPGGFDCLKWRIEHAREPGRLSYAAIQKEIDHSAKYAYINPEQRKELEEMIREQVPF